MSAVKSGLRFYSSLCILVLIAGCNNHGDKDQPADTSHINVIQQSAPVIDCDAYPVDTTVYSITSNKFMLDFEQNDLGCDRYRRVFSNAKKTVALSKNEYMEGAVDTSTIYKLDCDTVSIVSTKTNCTVTHFLIQSDKIKLSHDKISAGMTKAKFFAELRAKPTKSDIIRLSDPEGGSELIFMFLGDNLIRIAYNVLYFE